MFVCAFRTHVNPRVVFRVVLCRACGGALAHPIPLTRPLPPTVCVAECVFPRVRSLVPSVRSFGAASDRLPHFPPTTPSLNVV